MRIRVGREEDFPDLRAICRHYVAQTHVTFDLEVRDLDARRTRFDLFSAGGPHRLFVVEETGDVCGYACSGAFRAKAAYARPVETSSYLASEPAL